MRLSNPSSHLLLSLKIHFLPHFHVTNLKIKAKITMVINTDREIQFLPYQIYLSSKHSYVIQRQGSTALSGTDCPSGEFLPPGGLAHRGQEAKAREGGWASPATARPHSVFLLLSNSQHHS